MPADLLAVFERYPKHFGRFMAQIKRDGECWLWTGATDGVGYGVIKINGKGVRAHRVAYELFVGPIPPGLVIDHVHARGCTSKLCVRREHLEAVSNGENVRRGDSASAINARKTHCVRGHEFTATNTYWYRYKGRDRRYCKACWHERAARR